jgi:hypothetical protein
MNFLLIEIRFYMWPSVRSARLSVLLGYPLIDYILRVSYKGVGEQTSNGQKTAFTFSMIQYPFVSFLKGILDNMIRLHHFLSV